MVHCLMALRQKVQHYLREEHSCSLIHLRCYRSNIDWKKLHLMILKRISNRANDYPLKSMIPVAYDVLEARKLLIQGVSTLLRTIPVKSCKREMEADYFGMLLSASAGYDPREAPEALMGFEILRSARRTHLYHGGIHLKERELTCCNKAKLWRKHWPCTMGNNHSSI